MNPVSHFDHSFTFRNAVDTHARFVFHPWINLGSELHQYFEGNSFVSNASFWMHVRQLSNSRTNERLSDGSARGGIQLTRHRAHLDTTWMAMPSAPLSSLLPLMIISSHTSSANGPPPLSTILGLKLRCRQAARSTIWR